MSAPRTTLPTWTVGEPAKPDERATAPPRGRPSEAERILQRLEVWGQRLGLERIERLLQALGQPQRGLPTVLVAGTNGKGSTSALLSSIVQAAGGRCGLYTSPHLEQVEERLRFDGRAIDSAQLAELLIEVVAVAERQTATPPTYFEALTAAAFLYFSRQRADLAVFEVGLGGRLDATNAGEPGLSIITSIGFDHQEYLGSTLAKIAREKAGIARAGRPLLTWIGRQPSVRRVLRDLATEYQAEWIECDREVTVELQEEKEGRCGISMATPSALYELDSPLVGDHQVGNLGLAIRAAERLTEDRVVTIDRRAIENGVAACRWPGRLETVELPDGKTVLLDSAHNLPGARALARYLDQRDGEWDLLYGSLRGKRAKAVLPMLAQRCRRVTLTQPATERALGVDKLEAILAGRTPPAIAEADLERALSQALAQSRRPLLICGSLYVVGAARWSLRQRYGRPAAAVD